MDLQKTLSVELPPGHVVRSEEGAPLLWLSEDAAPFGLWSLLSAEHPRSELWPLLLDGVHGEPDRPWESQELYPEQISCPPTTNRRRCSPGGGRSTWKDRRMIRFLPRCR
ncbi:hypothetical protein [Nocardiopsis quinghaiensis]|uniref:hypothetical protein n=1 Tax=Nocardiopsis quinghaiensis TaxID=464995 RepID=UPI001CC26329|nr:hypothetical protein [Nocardiopsis quinghaiensis]